MRLNEEGSTLIEVLIAAFLMATSTLSVCVLQLKSLTYNHSAYIHTQANILASDMMERIRANVNNIGNYSNVPMQAFDVNSTPPTTPRSDADIYQWRKLLNSTLPNGKGQISCNTSCTITIQWGEVKANAHDDDSTTFTYTARI